MIKQVLKKSILNWNVILRLVWCLTFLRDLVLHSMPGQSTFVCQFLLLHTLIKSRFNFLSSQTNILPSVNFLLVLITSVMIKLQIATLFDVCAKCKNSYSMHNVCNNFFRWKIRLAFYSSACANKRAAADELRWPIAVSIWQRNLFSSFLIQKLEFSCLEKLP